MKQGINATAIVLMVTIAFLFIPCRTVQAGNTTVVISVSLGGGVAVGMVGWFIHLTYSQRVARAHPPSYGLSGEAELGKRLNLDDLRTRGNRIEVVFPSTLELRDSEDMPSKQTAFIRFVELPW
jgi:hypothetical protein